MPRGRTITKIVELEECMLSTAAEEFYQYNKIKGLADETQKTYKIYVDNFVKWCGVNTYLSDISPRTLDKYIQQKQFDGNKTVSIATNMTHLRRFFNFCCSREYMSKIEITIPKYEIELKEP